MSAGDVSDAVARACASAPRPIGVACSGGADSMALADAAIEHAGAGAVVVLTIDHGLQADSARIAADVVAWARGRGALGVARRVTVEPGASREAAARRARYAALAALATEHGLGIVWLAHTLRDQAETVLMRLLRGTGPAGLAGIPRTRGVFGRPLLTVGRAAIDAHVAARRLPVWNDPMNGDLAFTRVRVRAQLLPLLRAENPQLDAALVRIADSCTEWLAVIDAAATPFARLPIDCARLATQPAAIRKRALGLALTAAGFEPEAIHLETLDAVVVAPARGTRTIDVPGGTIVRAYDLLTVATEAVAAPLPAVPTGYAVRAWSPGDRMRPARLGGRSRKLSDLFADARIPRPARSRARVIVRADGTIVWAEHLGIAHADVLEAGEPELFSTFAIPTPT